MWIPLVGIIPIPAKKLRVQGEKSHHIWSVVVLPAFPTPLWESRTLQDQSELWTHKNWTSKKTINKCPVGAGEKSADISQSSCQKLADSLKEKIVQGLRQNLSKCKSEQELSTIKGCCSGSSQSHGTASQGCTEKPRGKLKILFHYATWTRGINNTWTTQRTVKT